MQSPYFRGGGGADFGPPQGMAALIGQSASIAAQDRATGSGNVRMAWDLLSQYGEKQKQTKALGKAAEAAFTASPTLQTKVGMTPEAFANLSNEDKHSVVTGAIQGDAYDRGVEEERNRTKLVMQQLAQQTADQAGEARFRASMLNMATPVTLPAFSPLDRPQTIGGGPLDGQSVANAYLRSGAPLSRMDDIGRGYHALAAGGSARTGFLPEQQGVPRPMPGVEGSFFVPTSQGGGQIIQTSGSGADTPEYTADDFRFDARGKPTHWRVSGDQFVPWDPKLTLAPGSKKGTVRVITPQQQNPFAAFFGGGQAPAEAAASAPATATATPAANEVIRVTKDGRQAVFDAKTKQFLRYADEP